MLKKQKAKIKKKSSKPIKWMLFGSWSQLTNYEKPLLRQGNVVMEAGYEEPLFI